MLKVQQGEVCRVTELYHMQSLGMVPWFHAVVSMWTQVTTRCCTYTYSVFLLADVVGDKKSWGKSLEEMIWRSSAIERETGQWWNFSRIVFDSEPQVVTGTKMQANNVLEKLKQTTANKQTKNMLHCFRSCWAFYCLWSVLLGGCLGFLNI